PRLIRALASSDRETRQAALKDLFACLLHQGSVNEATASAVPFLFELLGAPAVPERNWIAFLLASIAVGRGYLEAHAGVDQQRSSQLLAARGATLEAELLREEQVVERVRDAVGRSVLLLLPHLADGQSEIRAAVARALGGQAEHAAELIAALEAAEE